MVMLRDPIVSVVAGLLLRRPWSSNWNTPVGLTLVFDGALPWTAFPSAPITGVDQVVSAGLQPLPKGACCAAAYELEVSVSCAGQPGATAVFCERRSAKATSAASPWRGRWLRR